MKSIKNKETPQKQSPSKKTTQQQPTTQSASNSSRNARFHRKRGVSLSKQHSINFDRIYNEKDLTTEPTSYKIYGQKSTISRLSNSKHKITLQSVKSQKRLDTSNDGGISTSSRITIGLHQKSVHRVQEDEKAEQIHHLKYGKKEKKTLTVKKSKEKLPQYGVVRRF